MTDRPFRVLLVGGAGVFGSQLVDAILATTGWDIAVAGRHRHRTRRFAAARGARVTAVVLDARRCPAADLARAGAHAVVDAAGPFADASYGLALRAAAAGLHYVDLADDRRFVANFAAAVGPAARRAGTVAVTGASTTPALSNAAVDAITRGWQRVDDILVVLSPGNRAPRGRAVIRQILSYAGQPVPVFAGGAWRMARGWGMTRRLAFPGLGIRRRWAALCDTPDLDIMPARHRTTRSALFMAGLELPLLHLGLLAASLPVRWGWLASLAPLAPLVRAAAVAAAPFGTDRGGMLVEVCGVDAAGDRVRERLALLATHGEGPIIPALPALAILRLIEAGRIPVGAATACVGLLTLDDIAREFRGRRIAVERARQNLGPGLMPAALGASFALLPAPVAALHRPAPFGAWAGRAAVERGGSSAARAAAWLFGFPASGSDVAVAVRIDADADGETWTRRFAGRSFCSRLTPGDAPGTLRERFGPFDFRLAVSADAGAVSMRVMGWRLGALALPRALVARSDARETMDASGRFRFDVPIDLPLGLGRIVRYRGWLEPVAVATVAAAGEADAGRPARTRWRRPFAATATEAPVPRA